MKVSAGGRPRFAPELKRRSIAQLRVTEEEAKLLRHVSRRIGIPLAVYVRERALEAAREEIVSCARVGKAVNDGME